MIKLCYIRFVILVLKKRYNDVTSNICYISVDILFNIVHLYLKTENTETTEIMKLRSLVKITKLHSNQ